MGNIVVGGVQAESVLTPEQINRINERNVDKQLLDDLKKANIRKHEELIRKAAELGVHILCLQEVFSGPFFPAITRDEKWFSFAEPDTGPTIRRMQELAMQFQMVLIIPFYEQSPSGYFNTAAVIDADGTLLGKYRKSQIPKGDGFNEKDYFSEGDLGLPVFDTTYGKIGVYICYDRHFPAGFRALKERGAQVVFVPAATVENTSHYIWESELKVRAYDNQLFVVGVNRWGQERLGELAETKFYGSSLVINPRGRVLAKGSDCNDEVVCANINPKNEIDEAYARYPLTRDRRPREYFQQEPKPQVKRRF